MSFFYPFRLQLILLATGLLLVLGGLQFIRPTLTNPPVTADFQAPAPVKDILVTSCYNCHSNETKLPWFDKIVPAYWLVVRDVNRGRMHLNFSHFGELSPAAQQGFLYESVSDMQLGYMPPLKYRLVHPGSGITHEKLAVLKDYLNSINPPQPPTSPQKISAADAEYEKWIVGDLSHTDNVKPSLNGVTFFPDYKNWKPVSTTNRYDNHTLRIILGNDTAIRAIADKKTHPWPDGAAFAKISEAQQIDAAGATRPGSFVQVEFMVKDAKKYADTEGWGFGRWKTTGLVPYGKTADFATECASCHAPMKDNDFVYTMPLREAPDAQDVFNSTAALPGDLPYQPLQWKVITTSVDEAAGTMSTLYGNDIAVTHARTHPKSASTIDSAVALVTWKQREDQHWFGGRIPGEIQSVEFVGVSAGTEGYSYRSYTGSPLKLSSSADPTRALAILALRAAVMP